MLQQQRDQPRAAGRMQSGQEVIEGQQRLFAILVARQVFQQMGNQLLQLRARKIAAQGQIAPAEPDAHGARDFQRVAKAHAGQTIERLAVVLVLRKAQRAVRALRHRLEQLRILPLHVAQMQHAAHRQRTRVPSKPEKSRKTLERLGIRRQRVGLLVRDHLQPVLGAAQEQIGLAPVRAAPPRRPMPFGERSRASSACRRSRNSGWRPPAINCWVWTKNSISRMPPRPSLML